MRLLNHTHLQRNEPKKDATFDDAQMDALLIGIKVKAERRLGAGDRITILTAAQAAILGYDRGYGVNWDDSIVAVSVLHDPPFEVDESHTFLLPINTLQAGTAEKKRRCQQ